MSAESLNEGKVGGMVEGWGQEISKELGRVKEEVESADSLDKLAADWHLGIDDLRQVIIDRTIALRFAQDEAEAVAILDKAAEALLEETDDEVEE